MKTTSKTAFPLAWEYENNIENIELRQYLFALHNAFQVSLELTSILDTERLIYTYLANLLGLVRSRGVMLLLPDPKEPARLHIAYQRGIGPLNPRRRFRFSFSLFVEAEASHPVWHIDEPALAVALGKHYKLIKNSGIILIAPLIHMKAVQGFVLLAEKASPEPYKTTDIELLALLNNFFATVWRNAILVRELEVQSLTDGLTQVANRRSFQVRLEHEVDRALRYGSRFCLMMLDIDHFKHYNDRNGHLAGDDLLRQFAALLKRSVRSTDFVARYGGEEFAIILTSIACEGACSLAERLRLMIAEFPFAFREKQPLGCVSASIGVAAFPAQAGNAHALIEKADFALYQAKTSGRNRVCLYENSTAKNTKHEAQ